MQARARLHIAIGTAGILLAVPLFSSAAAEAIPQNVSGTEGQPRLLRGALKTAATARLAPDYPWVQLEGEAELAPLGRPLGPWSAALRDFMTLDLVQNKSLRLGLRAATLVASPMAGPGYASVNPSLGALDDEPLERRLLASGVFLQSAGDVRFGVDAVLATQRFASPTLSPLGETAGLVAPVGGEQDEQRNGIGIAVNLAGPLGERVGWTLGLRSRIDMDEYQRYRGVYSEPGDLDIPAAAAVGIRTALVAGTEFLVGAEHVFYSEINPLSSYALPNRFLALLGDSTSPNFAWRDLTVYSAALQGSAAQWNWSVRFSTSLQPEPSAGLLQKAIAGVRSDSNWSLGIGRALGRYGDLRLTASYAGAEYVLGSPYVRNVDPTQSEHFEFEAAWRWRF
jgi:hypothetical protein